MRFSILIFYISVVFILLPEVLHSTLPELLFCLYFSSESPRSALLDLIIVQFFYIISSTDTAFGYKNHIFRCQFTKPDTVFHIHSNVFRSRLFTPMILAPLFKALSTSCASCASTRASIPRSSAISRYSRSCDHQAARRQKYSCGTISGRLQNHIIIDHKIFSKYRNVHFGCNFPQILI